MDRQGGKNEQTDFKPIPEWVSSYLQHIGVALKEPSMAYLEEIIESHLNAVPFENISTLLQYRDFDKNGRLIPDEEQFVHQLTKQHMGGTCYAINSNLGKLLKQLGFHCRYAQLGDIHLGLLVQLPETKEWTYVDCGTAAPLFKPIPLRADSESGASFGGIEIVIKPGKEQGHYTFHRYIDGNLIKQTLWDFNIEKMVVFDDFSTAIQDYFRPGSLFMNTLRCQLWQLDKRRSLSLVNNQLSIRNADGFAEKRTVESLSDLREIIDREFRLPLFPVEEALDVLHDLGVNIFQEPEIEHRVDLG